LLRLSSHGDVGGIGREEKGLEPAKKKHSEDDGDDLCASRSPFR
jgi:hypothetical protein